MRRPAWESDRFVDSHGRHGWLIRDAGGWLIEHCVEGRWGCCRLRGVRFDDDRIEVNLAALRHLAGRYHEPERAPRLLGLDGQKHRHAGGGIQHGDPPRWIKQPREDDQ